MKIILIGILVFLFLFFPLFRTFILKFPLVIFYSARDVYFYFRHRRYNLMPTGKLDCYAAHFGGGKTLSMVNYVLFMYRRYNNKRLEGDTIQKILVLSNVKLNIPYKPLVALKDIVEEAHALKELDEKLDYRTVILVVLDEASAQLNSRSFKTNIDIDFLNTLITSRHYNINFLYSSQKFKLTDALLRSVTQRVILCRKYWRFLCQSDYPADEVELAGDISIVKPVSRRCYFISDKIFSAYDTLAVVDKLRKGAEQGDLLSAEEILNQRQAIFNQDSDMLSDSRKIKHFRKKR